MSKDANDRLAKQLALHQALHDPAREPRNTLRWLPEVRRWQAERLRRSFDHFLHDPERRPAAEFFLTDVYGDHDFTRRDADIARVLPMMRRLLPTALLGTVADAIELGALTQSLDLDMAEALDALAPRRRKLDAELYAEAYRQVGGVARRRRQVALIGRVGRGFGAALRMRGVAALLAFSRGPAKLAGLTQLQAFLERGFAAFESLGEVEGFIAEIERDEAAVSKRLFAGDPDPFRHDC
ncbi:hypothetical protein E2F46_00070 [Luteimonas aestuarii]|uniref:DUF8198 domain-containing protein n=1 Tax=Luteimonas aestuarii TaxID=453837 RepID=A0A4R5U3R0_9GAMM|nr:hypothetical protein [Luteimonas aestuarii]TDK28338.1 hypothetical protein E2F46_00070 [Luteimonas aestuarii]